MNCFGVTRSTIVWAMAATVLALGAIPVSAQGLRDADTISEEIKTQWKPRDPVVESLTAGDAKTPVEWFQVAQILADQEHPDLAKQYLKKILDAGLEPEMLVDLSQRFGSTAFARLAARTELQPEAGKLADVVLSAVRQQRQSPEQLAEFVDQLASPDQRTRDEAIVALRAAGPAAVTPLVEALADPARSAEYTQLRRVLASLGGDAVRPLLAYLESPDPKFVAQVISALAQIDDRDASLYLLAPYASLDADPIVRQAAGAALSRRFGKLPTPAEAAGVLARRARRYFDGQAAARQDENNRVTVWRWDAKRRQAIARTYTVPAANALLAERLAREALAIAPNDPDIRRLYLLTTLEAASYEAGLDEPLDITPGTPLARAAEFGPAELLGALDEAMSTGHGPAATAAARVLGETSTADAALNTGPTASPLARAVRSSDRRTRMAAVEAIVRLHPTRPFAGSSYLGESMAFLATSTGAKKAMVAARQTAEARRVAGYLSALGYDVDTAVTGRDMIKQLIESADYELALVDARIDNPPITILLQQLRHDGRTAALPVGILGTEGFYDSAEKAARDDPMAVAMVRPHDEQTVRGQVAQLEQLTPSAVAPSLRKQQAVWVLGQLAGLATAAPGVFDLSQVEKAVLGAGRSPSLAADAVGALEKLPTPEGQKTLVDLASDRRQPIELRKAALAALIGSVEKSGILLTTGEILMQYDRYNQSATADHDTQEVLGKILDVFEAAGKRAKTSDKPE